MNTETSTTNTPVVFTAISGRARRPRQQTRGHDLSEAEPARGRVMPHQKDWLGRGLSNSEGRALGKALSAYGISGGGDPSKTSERGRAQIRSLAKSGRLPSQYRGFR